ncbi:hypothetical protein [Streptomyces sp. NPDC051001]|uniref:hypothetical protein n=1 Tax=Streptomyces sp. NPDC051001 TaxID=3155795 RepID=UPI003415D1FD
MNPRCGRLRLVHDAGWRAARLRCTQTFGLTAAELRAEMRRLTSRGWQLWEIAYRFGCTSCEDAA